MKIFLPSLMIAGLLSTACSKHDHDHGHDHGHDHHGHAHTAPHGGTLVEIGEHQFNVELIFDATSGKLTAWLLDAHAEHFVRSAAPGLDLSISSAGEPRSLTLLPVANSATGETVGSTAQFEASAEWLKEQPALTGVIVRLDFRGAVFSNVSFKVTAGVPEAVGGHNHAH
jgi:hypothetical protein